MVWNVTAQQTYTLISQFKNDSFGFDIPLLLQVDSKEQGFVVIQNWVSEAQNQGYLLASFDSISIKSDTLIAHLYCGEKFIVYDVVLSGDTLQFGQEQQFKMLRNGKNEVSVSTLQNIQKEIIKHYENNGYPFVNTSLSPDNERLGRVEIEIDSGIEFYIDSIIVHSKIKLSQNLVERIINYKSGDPYQEDKIAAIKERLASTGYLTQKANPQVSFIGNQSKVHLFINQEKTSKFDFLLGFTRDEVSDKPTITGKGEIDLLSAFGKGERIYLRYENLVNANKQLDASVAFPFVFQMPFGAFASIKLDIRDTLLRNTQWNYGVSYQMKGNQSFSFYFEDQRTRNLSIDSNRIIDGKLPTTIDANRIMFGGTFFWRNTNQLYNPIRGWNMNLDGSVGARKLVQNPKIITIIENNELSNPFDTLTSKQNVFRVKSLIEKYTRIKSKFVLLSKLNLGWLQYDDSEQLGVNAGEAFRIGGAQDIRGFDNGSILTDRYGILTNEIRWLLARRSNVFLFQDTSFSNDIIAINESTRRFRYGFGIGATLDTAGGIFSIVYALGGVYSKAENENIAPKLRNAKIHFGYNIYF